MKTEGIKGNSKNLLRWFLLTCLFLAGIILVSVLTTSRAAAQCSTPKSSCVSCHGEGNHVTGMDTWNNVHVTQDICTYCHAGNGSAKDKNLAHQGLVAQPLSDTYTSCHSCHPADYEAKASQLAEKLNVTPGSCATPTAMVAGSIPGGSLPKNNYPISSATKTFPASSNFLALLLGTVALGFVAFAMMWLAKHPALKS